MENLDLTKFDPTTAELNALVERTSVIDVTDLTNRTALAEVKKGRLEIRDVRVAITKKGKELRDDANKFAKAVIEKEKELIAIITPEEERLQELEDKAKELEEMKKRESELPTRKEKLSEISTELADEEILKMSSSEFDVFIFSKKAEILDKQRAEMKEREQAMREVEMKAEREQEMREAEEKARVQERERIELDANAKEAAEIFAKEKLAKEVDYQKFLSDNGYNEAEKSNFNIVANGGEVKLYKLVATYKTK